MLQIQHSEKYTELIQVPDTLTEQKKTSHQQHVSCLAYLQEPYQHQAPKMFPLEIELWKRC